MGGRGDEPGRDVDQPERELKRRTERERERDRERK